MEEKALSHVTIFGPLPHIAFLKLQVQLHVKFKTHVAMYILGVSTQKQDKKGPSNFIAFSQLYFLSSLDLYTKVKTKVKTSNWL